MQDVNGVFKLSDIRRAVSGAAIFNGFDRSRAYALSDVLEFGKGSLPSHTAARSRAKRFVQALAEP